MKRQNENQESDRKKVRETNSQEEERAIEALDLLFPESELINAEIPPEPTYGQPIAVSTILSEAFSTIYGTETMPMLSFSGEGNDDIMVIDTGLQGENLINHPTSSAAQSQQSNGENLRENCGENSRENFGENSRENFGENSRENFGENSRENYGENSRENFGENSRENLGENSNTPNASQHFQHPSRNFVQPSSLPVVDISSELSLEDQLEIIDAFIGATQTILAQEESAQGDFIVGCGGLKTPKSTAQEIEAIKKSLIDHHNERDRLIHLIKKRDEISKIPANKIQKINKKFATEQKIFQEPPKRVTRSTVKENHQPSSSASSSNNFSTRQPLASISGNIQTPQPSTSNGSNEVFKKPLQPQPSSSSSSNTVPRVLYANNQNLLSSLKENAKNLSHLSVSTAESSEVFEHLVVRNRLTFNMTNVRNGQEYTRAIEEIADLIQTTYSPNHRVSLSISLVNDPYKPIYVSFRRPQEMTSNIILTKIARVTQSNDNFFASNFLRLQIVSIDTLSGGGSRVKKDLRAYENGELSSCGSLILSDAFMSGNEGKCLLVSIACGLLHFVDRLNEMFDIPTRHIHPRFRSKFREEQLRLIEGKPLSKDAKILKEMRAKINAIVNNLDRLSGINVEQILINNRLPCRDEIDKIQSILINFLLEPYLRQKYNFKINVYLPNGECAYEGNISSNECTTVPIDLLLIGNHFMFIVSLTGALATSYYCKNCKVAYCSKERHLQCPLLCKNCFQEGECKPDENGEFLCIDCNRKFYSNACFNKHLDNKICDLIKICEICWRTKQPGHDCNSKYCKVCMAHMPDDHTCYIKKYDAKQDTKSHIFCFYDFETLIKQENETRVLEVNLCVSQTVCDTCMHIQESEYFCPAHGERQKIFYGETAPAELVKYLLNLKINGKGAKVTALAHNAQRFDLSFISAHLYNRSYGKNVPTFILHGSKFYGIFFENIRFIDSLNFIMAPLSKLPGMFGIANTAKGYFPHLFNRPEYQNYVGPLPHYDFYEPNSMKPQDCEKFFEWYREEQAKNLIFDFKQEILKYCIMDVEILRKACIKFYLEMYEDSGLAPFLNSITIASFINHVARKNFYLIKPTDEPLAITPPYGYRLTDNQSRKAIKCILWFEKQLKIKIQSSYRGREKRIRVGNISYAVDGYFIDAQGRENLIDYHGCWWHYHFCLNKNNSVDAICENLDENRALRRERTQRKMEALRRAGYVVHEIWECEFDAMLKQNPSMLDGIPALEMDCLRIRDAFYGGNTETCGIYYAVKPGEVIRYLDFTSLYPFCVRNGKTPVGGPLEIIVGDEDCKRVDFDSFEGLIKCTILPPNNLFHPVLPLKINKKLMFPLCFACASVGNQEDCTHSNEERQFEGTWVVDEVKEALNQGYRIVKISEMVRFKVVVGYFKDFVDHYYKMKLYASGMPDGYNESNIEEFIEQVRQKEGVILDKTKFVKNAARRSMAKLILNSMWSKFSQNAKPQTIMVDSPKVLADYVCDPKIKIKSLEIVSNRCVVITVKADDENPPRNTNVALAAYVTCAARLHLNKALKVLGPRVKYNDTDSVLFCENLDEEPRLKTGPFLGELTNELAEYGPNAYITEFVSGGPKNYAFKVFNPDTGEFFTSAKVKGITLNVNNLNVINFESIKRAMLGVDEGNEMTAVTNQFQHMPRGGIRIVKVSKKWRPVVCKRRLVGHVTYPYGFDLRTLS